MKLHLYLYCRDKSNKDMVFMCSLESFGIRTMFLQVTFHPWVLNNFRIEWNFTKFVCRSSGPVSYGYSELENNNQSSMASTMCGDMALQTPGVEYSSTSIKREIVVSRDKEILQTAVINLGHGSLLLEQVFNPSFCSLFMYCKMISWFIFSRFSAINVFPAVFGSIMSESMWAIWYKI